MITRKQYMEDSKLHHKYYSQFITELTKGFILNSLSIKDIKHALENGDEHLNKIKIPYNNMGIGGNWWWDDAPINRTLLKKLGGSYSYSSITCIAKACAKELVKQQEIRKRKKIT